MYFIQSAKLSVIEGIVHGFADRGVCADPIEIARHFKLSKIAQLKQVHSGDVIIVENVENMENHYALSEGDALVTELRGVGIGIRTADCVPILLVDDRQSVIAAIHGGWRGTLSEIAMNTVSLIESKYGISPSKLTAVIGPSIEKCCYEIGEDVASLFEERFQDFDQYLFKSNESKYFLDLSLANKLGLQKAGVPDIEIIDICTKCNDNFYSYRREGKGVNTQLSFIALKQ